MSMGYALDVTGCLLGAPTEEEVPPGALCVNPWGKCEGKYRKPLSIERKAPETPSTYYCIKVLICSYLEIAQLPISRCMGKESYTMG